jgi:hypothetical protein
MLIYETTNQTDAIEKHVALPMSKLQPQACDKETTMLILNMLTMQGSITIPLEDKPFLFQLIEKRLPLYSFKIKDDRLTLLLAYVAKSAGIAILYLWYLQWWCKKNGVSELNLDKACTEVFPWGFFKESDLQAVWDSQKVSVPENSSMYSDNLVDYSRSGHSIQF